MRVTKEKQVRASGNMDFVWCALLPAAGLRLVPWRPWSNPGLLLDRQRRRQTHLKRMWFALQLEWHCVELALLPR